MQDRKCKINIKHPKLKELVSGGDSIQDILDDLNSKIKFIKYNGRTHKDLQFNNLSTINIEGVDVSVNDISFVDKPIYVDTPQTISPLQIREVKSPEDTLEEKEAEASFIKYESSQATSTDSTVGRTNQINTAPDKMFQEKLIAELRNKPNAKLIYLRDREEFYKNLPDNFEKNRGYVTIVVENYEEGLPIDELIKRVPKYAKYQEAPFPISTEFKSYDQKFKATSFANRNHTERIAIYAEKNGVTEAEAQAHFEIEFEQWRESTNQIDSDAYMVYDIRSISKGVQGKFNTNKKRLSETAQDNLTGFSEEEGRVFAKFEEKKWNGIKTKTKVRVKGRKVSEKEQKVLNDLLESYTTSIPEEFIPYLVLLYGNRVSAKDNNLSFKRVGGKIQVTYKQGEEIFQFTTDTDYKDLGEKKKILAKIFQEIPRSISFAMLKDTDQSVIGFIEGLKINETSVAVDPNMTFYSGDVRDYLVEYTYPMYEDSNHFLVGTSNNQKKQSTYMPINRYAYLKTDNIIHKGKSSQFRDKVNKKFKEKGIELIEVTEKEMFELAAKWGETATQGKYKDGKVYVVNSAPPSVFLEEKIHALTVANLDSINLDEITEVIKELRTLVSKMEDGSLKNRWLDTIGDSGDVTKTHIAELIGRGLSNEEMIKTLKSNKVEGNLFDRIKGWINSFIAKLVGMPTYYDVVEGFTNQVIDTTVKKKKKKLNAKGFFGKKNKAKQFKKKGLSSYEKIYTETEVKEQLNFLFVNLFLEEDEQSISSIYENGLTEGTFERFKEEIAESEYEGLIVTDEVFAKWQKSYFAKEVVEDLTEEFNRLESDDLSQVINERHANKTLEERVSKKADTIFQAVPKVDKDGDVVAYDSGIPMIANKSELVYKLVKSFGGVIDIDKVTRQIAARAYTKDEDGDYVALEPDIYTIAQSLQINPDGSYADSPLIFSFITGLQLFELKAWKAVETDTTSFVFQESGTNIKSVKREADSKFKENRASRFDKDNNPLPWYKESINVAIREKNKAKLFELLDIESEADVDLNWRNINSAFYGYSFSGKRVPGIQGFDTKSNKPLVSPFGDVFNTNKDLLIETARISDHRDTVMYLNSAGKMQNNYSLPNSAIIMNSILQSFSKVLIQDNNEAADEYIEAIYGMLRNFNSPKFKATDLYKKLTHPNSNRRYKLEIINVDGYSDSRGKNDLKQTTSKLENYPWLRQQYLNWDKGFVEFMRTETGSSAWGYRIVSPKGKVHTWVNGATEATNIFMDFLKGELDQWELVKDKDNFKYDPFTISAYLSKDLKDKLKRDGLVPHETEVREQLNTALSKVGTDAENLYREYGITDLDKVKMFGVNYKIHQLYSTLMFYGDLNWYGKKFFKRSKLVVSTGTANTVTKGLNETITHDLKSVFNEGTTGSLTAKVIAVQDIRGDYSDKKLATFKKRVQSSIDAYFAKSNLPPALREKFEAQLLESLKAYQEIEVADGQSWVSLDLAKSMLIQRDKWKTNGLQKMYDYEVAFLKMWKQADEDLKDRYRGKNSIDLEAAIQKLNLPLSDKKLLLNKPKGNWASMKWQYFGPIKSNSDVEAYNPLVSLKTSFAPVIPSAVVGTKAEQFLDVMYRDGYDIITIKSAMKTGIAEHGAASLAPFYTKDGINQLSNESDRAYEIYLPYLKEQLDTNTKVKKVNLLATQFRKLLYVDTLVPVYDNDGNYVKNEWMDAEVEVLFKDFINIQDQIVGIEKKKLLGELRMEKVGNTYIINDRKHLIDFIKEEMENQDKGDEDLYALLDAINIDETNFDFSGASQTLESFVGGLIKKRLAKIKLPGNALILKASPTTERLGEEGFGLKYYEYGEDKVSKAECKISISQGEFSRLLNRKDVREKALSNREDDLVRALNELITEGKIPEKLITAFGYRIPTSGLNLMDSYVVKEFLLYQEGSVIIVPPEAVIKAGEDFDIDKKNFYFPSITMDGNILPDVSEKKFKEKQEELKEQENALKEKYKEIANKELDADLTNLSDKEINDIIEDLRFDREMDKLDLQDEFKALKDAGEMYKDYYTYRTKFLTNRLIDNAIESSLHPSRFFQLVTPVSDAHVKNSLEEFGVSEEPSLWETTDIRTSSDKRLDMVLNGQALTGFEATDAVALQVMIKKGIRVNKDSRLGKLFYPLLSEKELSEIDRGDYLDLSNPLMFGGTLKSDVFNQFTQATIDAASSPILSPVNITKDTIPVMNWLTIVGIPVKRIGLFITQPILRERQKLLGQGMKTTAVFNKQAQQLLTKLANEGTIRSIEQFKGGKTLAGKDVGKNSFNWDTIGNFVLKGQSSNKSPINSKVNNVADGIKIIKKGITTKEELELFKELKPYLESQASRTNTGKDAPLMIGLGLRWDYTSNNPKLTPVELGPTINNSKSQKNKYRYYDKAHNGQPLGEISNNLKSLITKATGVDTSDYDGAIVNIYPKDGFISAHNDVDESVTASKYPVLVLNIGGDGTLSVEGSKSQKARKSYSKKEYTNSSLSSGDAYIFGEDGVNRDVYHRTLPSSGKGTLPELNIQGKKIPANSYRITITLRRVRPLVAGMSKSPKVINSFESTPTSSKPINISTKSKDSLGRKLTNPNWGDKSIMDIEAEYKQNASRKKAPHLNPTEALKYDMNLMYKLQVKKFRKHPELINEINKRGGLSFIETSSHIIGVRNSRWEGKGLESNFIKVLAKSYEKVSKDRGDFIGRVKEETESISNLPQLTNKSAAIEKKTKKKFKATDDAFEQLYVLWLFNKYQQEGLEFLQMKMAIGFDTNPDRNAVSIEMRERAIKQINVDESPFIDKKILNEMLDSSEISPYYQPEITKAILDNLSPIRSDETFIASFLNEFEGRLKFMGRDLKAKFVRIGTNDFLDFIVKTQVRIDGIPFNTHYNKIKDGLYKRFKAVAGDTLQRYVSLNNDGNIALNYEAIEDGFTEDLKKELQSIKIDDKVLYRDLLVAFHAQYGYNFTIDTMQPIIPKLDFYNLIKGDLMNLNVKTLVPKFIDAWSKENESFLKGKRNNVTKFLKVKAGAISSKVANKSQLKVKVKTGAIDVDRNEFKNPFKELTNEYNAIIMFRDWLNGSKNPLTYYGVENTQTLDSIEPTRLKKLQKKLKELVNPEFVSVNDNSHASVLADYVKNMDKKARTSLKASNEELNYVGFKSGKSNTKIPKFNSIQEVQSFINSIPLDSIFPTKGIHMDNYLNEFNGMVKEKFNYNNPIKDAFYFTYKGKSVETPFQLSREQEIALEELIEHVESGTEVDWTLEAKGGAGKTSIIGILSKYFKDASFVYVAPTHAATVQLALATIPYGNKSYPLTVNSGISRDYKTGKGKITKKTRDILGHSINQVMVVDEASMVNNKQYTEIIEAAKSEGIRVIFLGDPKQWTPVKQTMVAKPFLHNRKSKLTKSFRQGEGGLIDYLTEIRSHVSAKYFRTKDSDDLKFLSPLEYRRMVTKMFKEGKDATLIYYTNKSVVKANQSIRPLIGRSGSIQKDDLIIGYLGYANKQILAKDLANSVKYKVNKVVFKDGKAEIEAYSEDLNKVKSLGVSPNIKTTVYPLKKNNSLEIPVTEGQIIANKKVIINILSRVKEANSDFKKGKYGTYTSYLNDVNAITKPLTKIELLGDYVLDNGDLVEYSFEKHGKNSRHTDSSKFSAGTIGSLRINKGIDYGHAITSYKAQGATLENVFYDPEDSKQMPGGSNKVYLNEEAYNTQANMNQYVTASRAKNLFVRDNGTLEQLTLTDAQIKDELDSYSSYEKLIPSTNDFAIKHLGASIAGVFAKYNPTKEDILRIKEQLKGYDYFRLTSSTSMFPIQGESLHLVIQGEKTMSARKEVKPGIFRVKYVNGDTYDITVSRVSNHGRFSSMNMTREELLPKITGGKEYKGFLDNFFNDKESRILVRFDVKKVLYPEMNIEIQGNKAIFDDGMIEFEIGDTLTILNTEGTDHRMGRKLANELGLELSGPSTEEVYVMKDSTKEDIKNCG